MDRCLFLFYYFNKIPGTCVCQQWCKTADEAYRVSQTTPNTSLQGGEVRCTGKPWEICTRNTLQKVDVTVDESTNVSPLRVGQYFLSPKETDFYWCCTLICWIPGRTLKSSSIMYSLERGIYSFTHRTNIPPCVFIQMSIITCNMHISLITWSMHNIWSYSIHITQFTWSKTKDKYTYFLWKLRDVHGKVWGNQCICHAQMKHILLHTLIQFRWVWQQM